MSLPAASIRRPVTTIMVYVAVALLGVIAWSRMPQELFPSITYPQISVVTRYKDAAPEEIELLVTNPLEEVVGTVPGLRRISSVSKEEVSLVIAEFVWGTNMDFAALGVREKLDLVKERLPRGAEDPVVIKYNPFELPALVLNVSGPMPPYELLELTRRQIKDALEKVEGVASVAVTGGLEREILVEVDQGRLQASGTSIVGISDALSKANLNYPAGTIKEAFYEYLIRTIGEFKVVPEIKEIAVNVEEDEQARRGQAEHQQALQRQREQPLRREGGIHPSPRLVLLRDVAVVKDTYKERTSISRFNGQENISLAIQKQSGANTVQVVTRVLQGVERIRRSLPPGVTIRIASDQSVAIRRAVRGVVDAAWQGAILAFLVLWAFLRNPWAALNVTAAIPLSILATLSAMYFAGVSLNIISLGGLALGVGLLVDAGVVVVENIARHRELGAAPGPAAVQGTQEVAAAIFGTVLTTIVVFLPMVFVVGLVGQLFRDLAFTVTVSNVASLIVSLTLPPLLASRIRPRPSPTPAGRPAAAASRPAPPAVRWCLDHPGRTMLLAAAVFGVSVMVGQMLPREFLPKIDHGQFAIKLGMPPGTRLVVTDRVARRIEAQLRAHAAVRDVTVNIGSMKGQGGADLVETLGPHQGRILVGLKPRAERRLDTAGVIQEARAALGPAPLEGAQLEFIAEESALKATALAAAPVVLEVRGTQLGPLESLADTVGDRLRAVPGLYGVHTSVVPPSPETKVRVLKDRAATYHLSVSDIALTAQTAVKGFVATKFKEAGREIDVRVRLRAGDRADLGRVRRLTVRSPLQVSVPLAEVAYLAVGKGPTEIRRLDRQRIVLVSANLHRRPLGNAMEDVSAMLRRLTVPAGYEVRIAGEHEEMRESFRSLLSLAALAFLLVYMVMAATFESLWQPFLIMVTIPLAAVGIVVALWVTHTPVSAMVGLGVMLLGGIVVDNGIVLIDFVNQLQREQGLSTYDALLEASRTRLRPILMTTLTTVLGLLPLALGLSEGAELQGPMGITIMGGLLSATVLTLIVLPTVFLVGEQIVQRVWPHPLPAAIPAVAPAGPVVVPPGPACPPPPWVGELPDIPEDYGREEAVPSEPLTTSTPRPMVPTLDMPPPGEPRLPPPPPMPLPEPPPPPATAPRLLAGPPAPPALPAPVPAPPSVPRALNQRQRWLLDTLKTVGRIARKDYALQTGASIPTAARDLKELVDAGLIRGVGPLGPGRLYELVTPP
ncbi:MAG: efflux RND transporter permease subunit [Candidatus Omnitrophica bacterium]|nr:efflux RND transporter permease subunit [Candidatus Omnitrophota bacterium]